MIAAAATLEHDLEPARKLSREELRQEKAAIRTWVLAFLNEQESSVTCKQIADGLGVQKRKVAAVLRELDFEGGVICVHEGTPTEGNPSLWVGV